MRNALVVAGKNIKSAALTRVQREIQRLTDDQEGQNAAHFDP